MSKQKLRLDPDEQEIACKSDTIKTKVIDLKKGKGALEISNTDVPNVSENGHKRILTPLTFGASNCENINPVSMITHRTDGFHGFSLEEQNVMRGYLTS